MNVRELINELQTCDPEQFVYVADEDGTVQIAAAVATLQHTHVPARIRIDDDVVIVTAAMQDTHCRPDLEDGDEEGT